jgi:glycogen debranching enzyme
MKKRIHFRALALVAAGLVCAAAPLASKGGGRADGQAPSAQTGQTAVGGIPRFEIKPTDINLNRLAQPFTYFDKVGRKFAILGFESGNFEAWAYPLKILRNFEFSFLLGTSTVPVQGKDIVRTVSVDPAVTTLTFTYQSFTVRAHYVAAVEDPGAVILLEVDSTEPLTIICSFLPVLQPMWPAGIGGQYAYWDDGLKAYLISEPTRKNHGYVGSPAGRGISYTPAHMLSDTPNQFRIEVPNPNAVRGSYLPIVLAGGEGKREDVRAIYQKLVADPGACYREAVRHYQALRDATLRVRTPDRELDLALEWAKVALDGLLVDNPDLGRGLVAGLGPSGTGGRPGFGWFFGTDAYLNSLSLNSLNAFGASRDALAFTQKWQRKDGKMAHELSQAAGYLRWWEDYPYGYIHGDTTPYYIVAVEDYVRATGDLGFLKASWPSLLRAYAWCVQTDADGDGLMDNAKAGLGALEFGSLTGIQTDIYLAAVWARANRAMAYLAGAIGDKAAAEAAGKNGPRAAKAVDEKYWDKENDQYSYAFNKDGRLVGELTPWSAVALAWGLGTAERGTETLVRMNASDLTTDWGTRMLSTRSPLFEPLNYNYGAAWPFLGGWVSAALFDYDFVPQGFQVLMANARHTFENALGTVTELYSGALNAWPQEGVPHQGFSTTGIVLPAVRGLLGLEGDALHKELAFRPAPPAGWARLQVSNWKVGPATFDLEYERQPSKVLLRVRSSAPAGYKLVFAPALGLGTVARSATMNGAPLRFEPDASRSGQAVRPSAEVILRGEDQIEFAIDPAPEIVPPDPGTRPGDSPKGLRIIRMGREGTALKVTLEGLAGGSYRLAVENADLVDSVAGAAFDGKAISVEFPAGKPGEFVRKDIIIRTKK